MAFVKCRNLRSDTLHLEGRGFPVDGRGVVELPDWLALRLVEDLPRDYALVEAAAAEPRAALAVDLGQRVRELEDQLVEHQQAAQADRERYAGELQAARFQLDDRDQKLSAARAELEDARQQLAELPALRDRLSAAQEQVQQLLLQKTEPAPAASEAAGRKGKTR